MWDPDIYSEEVYDWIVDPRDPEGDYEDTFNMNDVSTDRGLAYANHRRTIMNKTAITKNTANEVDDEATAIRKDLGITLNGSGMPYICFRDGSFLEIRAKVQDARSREQGIEQDAKYIVVWAYPSLGFENQVGLAGYKNIKYAENMLANCAKVHLAHGLTYTY